MEDLLKSFWGMAATIVEGAAALLIAIGAAEAFVMSLISFRSPSAQKMQILDNWLQSPQSVRFSATFSIRTLKRCPIQERAPIKIALKVAALSLYPRHLLLEPVDQTSRQITRNHQHWRVHGTI
jgi:hypothetical protein